jgi:hypothetical protein
MSVGIVPIFDQDDPKKIVDATQEDNCRPRVGIVMRVGTYMARTYQHQDYWQTTLITKILRDDGHEVHFKTGNSEYIWKEF